VEGLRKAVKGFQNSQCPARDPYPERPEYLSCMIAVFGINGTGTVSPTNNRHIYLLQSGQVQSVGILN
jgi:hypothetical protein